jgi:replicative DNA helicase
MSDTPKINYSNTDTERKALATLANLSYPAEEALSFEPAWFTSPDASDILAQLRAATAPIALDWGIEVTDDIPAIRNELRELYTLRQLEILWTNIAPDMRKGSATQDTIDRLYAGLKIIKSSAAATANIATLADISAGYWSSVEKRKDGAKTGFNIFDNQLGGGFLPGTLAAILGAPGMGKTAFSVQLSETMASLGRPVVYVTSEDTPFMLLCRALARLYSLDYKNLSRGLYSRSDVDPKLEQLKVRASWHRLLTVDASAGDFNLDTVAERARQHFNRYDASQNGGPGILVVDYLQRLVRSSATNAADIRQAVTGFTEKLRVIANELECTVIVLSAQGRSAYGNGADKSALATAKESGDIEYTCDVLMAISEVDEKKVSVPLGDTYRVLRVDKNRQGETGQLLLKWEGQYQRFSEVEA